MTASSVSVYGAVCPTRTSPFVKVILPPSNSVPYSIPLTMVLAVNVAVGSDVGVEVGVTIGVGSVVSGQSTGVSVIVAMAVGVSVQVSIGVGSIVGVAGVVSRSRNSNAFFRISLAPTNISSVKVRNVEYHVSPPSGEILKSNRYPIWGVGSGASAATGIAKANKIRRETKIKPVDLCFIMTNSFRELRTGERGAFRSPL